MVRLGLRCRVSSLNWPNQSTGEPGFIWKIWTENEANHEAGGIYLFRDEDTAQAYIKKHTARLKHLGVEDVTFKIFDINEPLTKINHGHIG